MTIDGYELVSVRHVNFPNVGDEHRPEDCPGGGPWPCNRKPCGVCGRRMLNPDGSHMRAHERRGEG